MTSSDVDALRQLLAKRTEEVREARAALDATQGALQNHRQSLKGLLMRAEALVPEKKAALKASASAGPDAEAFGVQNRVLAETSELMTKLSGVLAVMEAETESKVAAEKRRAEMFLSELRGVRPDVQRASAGGSAAKTELELEAVKAELGEALRRVAAYEVWEKELGSLDEVKNHLMSEISHLERRITQVTGQPAVRSLRYHLQVGESETGSHKRLIPSSGEDFDLEKLKRVVLETSEVLSCRVCLSRPVEVVTFPCLHIVQCRECAAKTTKCCECRVATGGNLQVNFGASERVEEFLSVAGELSGAAVMEVMEQ